MEVQLGNGKYYDLCLNIGDLKIYGHKYHICPQLKLIDMLLNHETTESWPPVHTLSLYPPDDISQDDLKDAFMYIYKPREITLRLLRALIYLGSPGEPLITSFKKRLNIKTLQPEEKEMIKYLWEHCPSDHQILWFLVALYGLDKKDFPVTSPGFTPIFFTTNLDESYGLSLPLLKQEDLKSYFREYLPIIDESWNYFIVDPKNLPISYHFEALGMKCEFHSKLWISDPSYSIGIKFTGINTRELPCHQDLITIRGIVFVFSHSSFRHKEIFRTLNIYKNDDSSPIHNILHFNDDDIPYRIVLYLQEN